MTTPKNTIDIDVEVRVGRAYDIDIDGASLDELTQDEEQSFEAHVLDSFDAIMEDHDMSSYIELDATINVDMEGIFHDLEFKRFPRSYHEEIESVYATISIPITYPLTNDMLDELKNAITDFSDFGDSRDWDKPEVTIPENSYPTLFATVSEKAQEIYNNYHDVFTPYQMAAKLFEELKDTPFDLPQSIESSFENIFENSPANSVHKNIVYKVASTTMDTIVEQQEMEHVQPQLFNEQTQSKPDEPIIRHKI